MSHFYFFSYGSNLLLERIKARTPSVEIVQVYQLSGFRILFNKKSNDDSTKTNIEKTRNPEDYVIGIIHKIDMQEKPILDKDEAGYHLDKQSVKLKNGEGIVLNYYIADSGRIKVGKPYDWYIEYVIMGAIENEFSRDYIQKLLSIDFTEDKQPENRGGYNQELSEKIAAHKKRNPEVWKRAS